MEDFEAEVTNEMALFLIQCIFYFFILCKFFLFYIGIQLINNVFQVCNKVIPLYIYMYLSFFKFFFGIYIFFKFLIEG